MRRDAQLRDAGWEADSQAITYKLGPRPQKGQNLAIAEWPTSKGPADYVLFAGLSDLGFLRGYQRDAIRAVEGAIEDGRRECLVAMATGTGKTKTCIALAYRLIKTGRFRRILFLVDRSALGDQARDAFNSTVLEGLLPFSKIFGFKTSGGFAQIDRTFDGKLGAVLDEVNDAIWQDVA